MRGLKSCTAILKSLLAFAAYAASIWEKISSLV
jgi:hypothetical protein